MIRAAFLLTLLHQQTAPTLNNRYVKLTCMENRVRLAYTILYGDLPGEAERRKMDKDKNGSISADEAKAFGASLGEVLSRTLTITIDGERQALHWESIDVGLGTNVGVGALPFSVDLVTTFAPREGGGEHEIRVDDRFEPPYLGETEVLAEEAPGTRVVASWSGAPRPGLRGLKWLFEGPRRSDLEDRSLGLRYRTQGGGAGLRHPLGLRAAVVAFALAIVLGVGFGLFFALRKKTTSEASRDSQSPSSPPP
jgi:hypothetical protein